MKKGLRGSKGVSETWRRTMDEQQQEQQQHNRRSCLCLRQRNACCRLSLTPLLPVPTLTTATPAVLRRLLPVPVFHFRVPLHLIVAVQRLP